MVQHVTVYSFYFRGRRHDSIQNHKQRLNYVVYLAIINFLQQCLYELYLPNVNIQYLEPFIYFVFFIFLNTCCLFFHCVFFTFRFLCIALFFSTQTHNIIQKKNAHRKQKYSSHTTI